MSLNLFGTKVGPKVDAVEPVAPVAPVAPNASAVTPDASAVTPEMFNQLLAGMNALSAQVKAGTELTNSLQATIAAEKQNTEIVNMAVSAGATLTDAQLLASKTDMTYEQKLKQIISASASFKAEALNVLQDSSAVGGGTQTNLGSTKPEDIDMVKTTSQAVAAVMKADGISGPAAVAKAKLRYPEVYSNRTNQSYGKINLSQLKVD